MAVKTAGTARYQYRTTRNRRRLVTVIIALVLVVALILVIRSIAAPKATGKTVSNASAGQAVSLQARQTSDINLVAGAIGQYVAANSMLPVGLSVTASGGLVLCGTTCNATANAINGFSAYEASNIRLVSYAPDLAVPNQQTMYLVAGAKCNSNGHLGAPNPTPHSMVILFAVTNATATVPRCLVL